MLGSRKTTLPLLPMFKSNLPHELLLKIFADIPRKALFQCLFVCKSWYISASSLYFESVSFGNFQGDVKMLRQTLENDTSGWKRYIIRKLDVCRVENPSSANDFIAILNACTKLQEIDFGSNVDFMKAMHTSKALRNDFSHLQKISAYNSIDEKVRRFYQHLVGKYRRSITSLYFHLTKTVLAQKPIYGKFGSFLGTFPHLKRLGLHYHPAVSVSRIIYYCPQLEYLEILRKKDHTRVNVCDSQDVQKFYRHLPKRNVQLRGIHIMSAEFSQDLCDLLYNYCPRLYQITLTESGMSNVVNNWTLAMNQSTMPPHDSSVEKIRFGQYYLDSSCSEFQPLASCFPALKEVDLGTCKTLHSYNEFIPREDFQYQLDLNNTNLERLKMNISRPFEGSFGFSDRCFKRVIIQVIYEATRARYFCREGDFGSDNKNKFIEIDSETKNTYMAEPPSFDSDRKYTCSIYIQAAGTFSTIILDHSNDFWLKRGFCNEEHTDQIISLL